MTAKVAIVVVTHFSADQLGSCLDSIGAAVSEPVITIVVDNDTTDGSVRDVVIPHADVILVETGQNLGYGRAVNRARESLDDSVDWILVANPDTVFSAGSIDELLAVARSHGEAGAVGPRIVNADGTVYPSARALPSLRTGIGHALFARAWPLNPWTAAYLRSHVYDSDNLDVIATGWLSGACVLVRRSAFEQIGGFDPRYFMYFEDVDLGKRFTEAGWTNLHVPSAIVTHTGGQSTKRYSRRMLIAHHQSAYRYLAERYSAWYLWPLRVALRLSLFLRSRLSR